MKSADSELLHILVVEDDNGHVAAIKRAFSESAQRFDLEIVSSLREYRERVAVNPPDIAVVDLNLPDGRAVDILTQPSVNAPFPVLVMTAFGNQHIVLEVMKAGAMDYIVKSPDAFDGLPHVVESILREWNLLQSQKKGIDSLRISEAKHKLLFDNSFDAIFVHDINGRVLEANPQACKQLGYTRGELLSITVNEVDATQNVACYLERISRLIASDAIAFETVHRQKNGSLVPTEVNARKIVWDGQQAVLSTCRDITARKQFESEVLRLNIELEQRVTERTAQLKASNSELDAFCHTVSHDLMAPLRHIDGFVDLLVSRYRDDLPDKGRHYIDTIAATARQMGVLINDLLRFSRTCQATMRNEPIDMNLCLKEALNSYMENPPGSNVEWIIGNLPSVRGDHSLIRQVWVNLISNAVKFTAAQCEPRITICARDEGSDFVFIVADNGVGFDMQYSGKLFGVFQRLHDAKDYEGSGIGLASVQRIIARHGGHVWAEAELNKGATFYFTLPKQTKRDHT